MRLAENTIRLTGLPAYCSACMNQNPDILHIDMDAACDRGYGTGPVPVAMDDLVLCEQCLREAARLVGMTDDGDLHRRLVTLEKQLAAEKQRADSNEDYAAKLE